MTSVSHWLTNAMAHPLELGAQLEVVVDLAVVGDPDSAAGIDHRLVAGLREVEDLQPAAAQRRACRIARLRLAGVPRRRATGPDHDEAGVVGPAVRERLGHVLDEGGREGPLSERVDARDAAQRYARKAANSSIRPAISPRRVSSASVSNAPSVSCSVRTKLWTRPAVMIR